MYRVALCCLLKVLIVLAALAIVSGFIHDLEDNPRNDFAYWASHANDTAKQQFLKAVNAMMHDRHTVKDVMVLCDTALVPVCSGAKDAFCASLMDMCSAYKPKS
jgi:hypothetical protein